MAEILKLVSEEHHLVLNQLAGKKDFIKSKDVFYYVAPYFYNKYLKTEIATPKRTIGVYETIPGAQFTLMEMFGSLPGPWNKKWLSESQITKVCKHFRSWLRSDGYSNYILCNPGEPSFIDEEAPHKSLVVALVTYDGNEMQVHKLDLDDPAIRRGAFKFRVIVPKVKIKK